MAKSKQVDYMKYIPIVVMAVSLVSGYTLLQVKTSANAEAIENVKEESDAEINKLKDSQKAIWQDTTSIKVGQASQTAKLDSIYELVKDLKDDRRN